MSFPQVGFYLSFVCAITRGWYLLKRGKIVDKIKINWQQ